MFIANNYVYKEKNILKNKIFMIIIYALFQS